MNIAVIAFHVVENSHVITKKENEENVVMQKGYFNASSCHMEYAILNELLEKIIPIFETSELLFEV